MIRENNNNGNLKAQPTGTKMVESQVSLPPNSFINADCMDYLTKCPSNYFQLAIVDPPYGINEFAYREKFETKLAQAKKYNKAVFEQTKPDDAYFNELMRVSKNQIIWGGNYFGLYGSRCWIVWDKDNTGDFADCELAWTSFDSSVRKFTFRWNGMLQQNMKEKEERIHPTQKPVALYKWLLKKYASSGDLILDTHVGSASSLIACKELGYDYVGFEIDTDYYKQAEKRLSRAFRKYELEL